MQGTNYVFDVPLEAEFAQKVLAADPSRYVIDKSPRDLPRGAVPLATATFTYDLPMFKRGSMALERKPGTQDMLWIEARLNSEAGKPVVASAAVDFPLRAGTKLESGRKYRSESGQHMLVLQADGNLVARDASGGFVWSALSRNADPSAVLVLGQDGVLRLVSGRGNAQLWASSGEAGPSGSAGTAPQAPAQTTGTPQWEVGKQYALRDRSGFRYVKLISIDTSAGTRYLFGACPTSPAQGVAMDPKVVMRVSDARAQGLAPLLEPCDVAQVPLGR